MFITPTLSISCITCMRGEEGSSVNELSGRGGGKNNSSVRTSELYGGLTSGSPWDDGTYDGVREITLVYGQCIDSISVAYDKDGQFVKPGKHGGVGGGHLHKPLTTVEMKLEYPEEFLVGVSGYSCSVPGMAPEVLRSLKLESNRRSFGPFGVLVGNPFSFRVQDGEQIVGLKGRNGWYLDAIGFHISPAPKSKLFRRVQQSSIPSELYGGVAGGGPWDDGVYDGVREITLVYGQCIDSICEAYDINGKLVKTGKHGGYGGNHLHKNLSTVEIKLEYPSEFLVSVSGYSSSVPGMAPEVLRSLKFETNKRSYGPFGVETGTPFTFRVKDGEKIVGLKGRNGWYLDAIGFHISYARKRKRFRIVRKHLSKAYESLVQITKPLTNVECTLISL
ncbi:putative jacalin-like lectin domain-containing protein [Rosa chinensis]|uniref:Putative jacalin-like lectin domain-containing protein n=1 Tax=Rosa chinensis TaxID=74649 RepID=A0A2P6RVZ0_ROSCH|nr:jacalin-related lectin 3 [Rosa chinensis]PRQ50589.1 putative jacalin-like lectin domain-containing protein [Rosa chinensis]